MNLAEEFLSDCAARGMTKHSIESYKSCITDFLKINKKPSDVGLEDLRAYLVDLRDRGLQGSTLKEYFSAIAAFYDFLIFEGRIKSNLVPGFRKRYLRIKKQHGGENTRQLISIDQMSRLIYIADDILDWREQRAGDIALWIHNRGHRVSKNYVYNMVMGYASLLGLHDPKGPMCRKFGPHCCRHFFTTMMRRNRMPREFIQELRGDRRKEAIDIYDHIDIEELRRSYLECVPKFLNQKSISIEG